MNAIQAIKTRRSIRQFTNREISGEQIDQLLEAAMSAPSAYNHQPWQFIVVTDKVILKNITLMGHYSSIKGATAGILVCGDLELETEESFLVQSCSASIENILITANALGLGAVWASIYPFKKEMSDFQLLFNLPKTILPITFIPLGYSANEVRTAERFDKLKIHYNQW